MSHLPTDSDTPRQFARARRNPEDIPRFPLPEPPADFEEFWKTTWELAAAIPPRVTKREIPSQHAGHRVYEVEFDSLGGFRSGGWITVPKRGKITRGMVIGHGYGGRACPEPGFPGPSAVTIFPCARGFNRSASRGIPGRGGLHVLHGITQRETYSHRGCVAEIWAAATALLDCFPEAADRLHYAGSSFGGGIGALALPWDPRFHRAHLDVPSFGNHPVRVGIPCAGSGESVRRLFRVKPDVLDTLVYFDAAVAAQFLRIPTLVSAATHDPVVPPDGQFSVFQALAGPRRLFVRSQGHPGLEDEDEILNRELSRWWELSDDAI